MKRSIVVLTMLFLFVAVFATQARAESIICVGEIISLYTNNTEFECVLESVGNSMEYEIYWTEENLVTPYLLNNLSELEKVALDDKVHDGIGMYIIQIKMMEDFFLCVPAKIYELGTNIEMKDGLIFVSNMDKSWYKMCQMDKLVHEIMFGSDENGNPHGFVFDPMLNYPSQPVVHCDPNGSPPPVPEDKDLHNVPVQCDPNGAPPFVPKDEDLINVPVQCDPNGGPPPVPDDMDLNSP